MNWKRVQRSMSIMTRVVLFLVELLLAFGGSIFVGTQVLMQTMSARAAIAVLNDGASPTGMQSGNTPQAALTTHYNKNFIENLKARLVMLRMCTRLAMSSFSR
jgi:hypothetical protein